MGTFVLAGRLVLAAVFATAGVGKLLDLPGSRQALFEFGVPRRALRPAAVLLPLAELATAVALLFPPSARWGGVAALLLLLAFMAGIANAMSRGKAPDCHCFGQIHSAPAGRGTLARNAALAALGVVVVAAGPGPAISTWIEARTAAELAATALGVGAATLAMVALRLWLDNRSLRAELEGARADLAGFPRGLPVGAAAPSFELEDVDGETVTLESLCARGQPVALIFVGPTCGQCWMMLPHIRRWQDTLAERLTVAVVSGGTAEHNQEVIDEHGFVKTFLHDGGEVFDDYRVEGTPAAVMVSPDGRIASSLAEGPAPIEPLVRLTIQRAGPSAEVSPAA
jgi:methylamine dehydrogenase accessory protein MauD